MKPNIGTNPWLQGMNTVLSIPDGPVFDLFFAAPVQFEMVYDQPGD